MKKNYLILIPTILIGAFGLFLFVSAEKEKTIIIKNDVDILEQVAANSIDTVKEELAEYNSTTTVGNINKDTDVSNTAASSSGQTISEIDTLFVLLTKLVNLYKVEEQSGTLRSVHFSYDSMNNLELQIRDTKGYRDNFVSPSTDELLILNRIGSEYNLSRKEVLSVTDFTYESIEYSIETSNLESRIFEDHVLITMGNSSEHTFWLHGNTIKNANKKASRIINIPSHILWGLY